MSNFLFSLIVIAVIATVVILWKNREDLSDEPIEEELEDSRVPSLLRGINFLLSDKPDQALQEMVSVAKIRSESAEVYLALGEMFRAQGEYGRAVRIHQNLLARPDAPADLHFQAYVSLGRDFQAGGLLDRAIKHYGKALAMRPDHLESLQSCLRIREQSHEWDEAEWLVSRLEQIEDKSYHEHRAYLKAEMARDAMDKRELLACESLLVESLKLSKTCTHAHLLQIEYHILENRVEDALAQAKLCITQVKQEHYSLLISPLMPNEKFYATHAEPFFYDAWQHYHDSEFGVTWIEEVHKLMGSDAADTLRQKLDLQQLSIHHELRLMALQQGDQNLVSQAKLWRLTMKHYACKVCGVQIHDMRWHCPKCNKWGTMEPVKSAQTFGEEDHA